MGKTIIGPYNSYGILDISSLELAANILNFQKLLEILPRSENELLNLQMNIVLSKIKQN